MCQECRSWPPQWSCLPPVFRQRLPGARNRSHLLEAAQRGDLDITRWLSWFLGCLDRAIGNAEKTLAPVLHKAKLWQRINRRPVNNRQREVINRMLDGFEGFLTTSKYARLAKCSQDTALRDIRELLERGIIVQNPGRGRSTSYRLAEPDMVLR